MRRAGPAVVLLLLVASACAPKAPPAVTPTPRFPAFVTPEIPPQAGEQPALSARHQAGWQRLQAGDLRGAERDFRWVTSRAGTFFPSETGLGYVALARRDAREALQHFELALAVSPRYASALAGRGEALLVLGRLPEAVGSLEAALAMDPRLTDLRPRIEALRFKAVEDLVAGARRARDAGRFQDAVTAYERAIRASPESSFLYRELAAAEQRLGRQDAALAHARQALSLDPSDARAHVIAGEILEARREFTPAAAEYEAANALEPSEDLKARIERARERAALAELPPEFHAIAGEPAITRAQLAALVSVHLEDVLAASPPRPAPVMTDTRGHWAGTWIAATVRSGVMDPFPNHTFQPGALVRRADLAAAVSRLLTIALRGSPGTIEKWRSAHPRFSDLPPAHLSYPAAAMAVEARVLDPAAGNAFEPGRPVSGTEAVDALNRLHALWRESRGQIPKRR